MSTRAKWTPGIPDLYSDLTKAAKYHTLEDVSRITGRSPVTLSDALSREPVTAEDNPMSALSRPAARIGSKPLYSPEQVKRYQKLAARREAVESEVNSLEKITPEQAKRAGLLSTTEIAGYAGVHEQTIRRWSRQRADFPRPVARRERAEGQHSGVPSNVRELEDVRRWLVNYCEHNEGERAQVIAARLRQHGIKVAVGSKVEAETVAS